MTGKLFGTTGVRKLYGSEFDLEMALNLGKALGSYLKDGKVLIARDARTTGRMVVDALSAGILSTGVSVTRAGIVPTPTLAFLTKQLGFDTGLMVTASHNPPEYTGVKFWRGDSMGYMQEQEAKIEEIYQSKEFKVADWDSLGTEHHLDAATRPHIDAIKGNCEVEKIREKKFRVIVDPGNGAACVLTPYLLQELGCKVTSINAQLDGHFPGRKSEPEEETLGDLMKLVKETGADLGVAHDGDSDRVVFVTGEGEVIRGDRTIALISKEILKGSEKKTIVTTVDSSKVLDETVERAGGKALRTPVGDIHVAVKIKDVGAVFGGEACGVFIFPEFHLAPEPFLATCRILELMANTGQSLTDLISEIPVYPLTKTKVKCANDKKKAAMDALTESLPEGISGIEEVLTVDGLGLSLSDGWILVRPSGTEPVIRITCEASTKERVDKMLDSSKKIVEDTLSSL